MKYESEREMYPAIIEWLKGHLKSIHKKAAVDVYDSSRRSLSRLISDVGLEDTMPSEWISWDIRVDITAFIRIKKDTRLAFVECKNKFINLRDLSQLIGYSLIAQPHHSFIVSPQGPSDSLRSLLKTYDRIDVLRYHYRTGEMPRSIVVAKWAPSKKQLDWSSIIADDTGLSGRL